MLWKHGRESSKCCPGQEALGLKLHAEDTVTHATGLTSATLASHGVVIRVR